MILKLWEWIEKQNDLFRPQDLVPRKHVSMQAIFQFKSRLPRNTAMSNCLEYSFKLFFAVLTYWRENFCQYRRMPSAFNCTCQTRAKSFKSQPLYPFNISLVSTRRTFQRNQTITDRSVVFVSFSVLFHEGNNFLA